MKSPKDTEDKMQATAETTQAQPAPAPPSWTKLQKDFRAARACGTPLISITTPDPAATIEAIKQASARTDKQGKAEYPPIVHWDIVRGLTEVNPAGKWAIAQMLLPQSEFKNLKSQASPNWQDVDEAAARTTNPVEFLAAACKAPEKTILFFANANRYLAQDRDSGANAQGVWNLRDLYKSSSRQLILLSAIFVPPPELAQDILCLDEPLPDEAQLAGICKKVLLAAMTKTPENVTPKLVADCVDATTGLSAFSADQVVAMSLFWDQQTKAVQADVREMWEKKRRVIEQTPGLRVWRGNESMGEIGGAANIKTFLKRYFEKNTPRLVLWLDEIEKMFGGAQSDTSGVTQEMLGKLLSWMEDQRVTGAIFIGPGGSGKSMMAKAAGNLAGIPTIAGNLGDMKGSLVGQSNENLARALKVLDAAAGQPGKVICIASCNGIAGMPPELLGRFRLGTFFFDLPTAEERRTIWDLYIKKYKLEPNQPIPGDHGWAGRDIQKCAENASILGLSLMEAAAYVVSITQSSGGRIDQLRKECSGRYISANHPGLYKFTEEVDDAIQPTNNSGRNFDLN